MRRFLSFFRSGGGDTAAAADDDARSGAPARARRRGRAGRSPSSDGAESLPSSARGRASWSYDFASGSNNQRNADGGEGGASSTPWGGSNVHRRILEQQMISGAFPPALEEMLTLVEQSLLHVPGRDDTGFFNEEDIPAARREVVRVLQLIFGEAAQNLFGTTVTMGSFQDEAFGVRSAPRERDKAHAADVHKIPLVTHWTEEGLEKWSISALKRELDKCKTREGIAPQDSSFHCVDKADLIKSLMKLQPSARIFECVECAVCLNDFKHEENLRVLPCGHCFHVECIDKWLLKHSATCPLCQKPISGRSN